MAILYLLSSILVVLPLACSRDKPTASAPGSVVLYTSVDEPVATPILKEFERRTGIRVDVRTDTEATKSVGLAERIVAERDNPQAGVYWGNEIFLTIRLAEQNLLAAYQSPLAADIPQKYKDPSHRWAGNGMRARVIAVWDEWDKSPYDGYPPTKLADLLDPGLKDRTAIARPTAGTTGSHVAAIYAKLGTEHADVFFRALRANGVKLLGGNSVVAQQVAQGNFLAGLTDNDDVDAARAAGGNVRAVLPDQAIAGDDTGAFGTLALPCTVALVAGREADASSKRLVDYLLSAEVEQRLITAKFAAYSVRGADSIKTMSVDYREVARGMPEAVRRATAILEGRE